MGKAFAHPPHFVVNRCLVATRFAVSSRRSRYTSPVFEQGESSETSGSGGILFWAAVFALVSVLLFGLVVPSFNARHGHPIVDLEIDHSPARAVRLIEAYGVSGRHDFLVFLSLDCLFPVAGAMFLIAILRRVLSYLGVSQKHARVAVLFAAVPAVCDLIENTLEASLVVSFPRFSELLAQLAWLATQFKVTTLAATYLLVLAVLAAALRTRIKSSRS